MGSFIILDTNYCDSNNNCFLTNTWGTRLVHIREERMKRLAQGGLLGSLVNIDLPICESCLARKVTRKPFGKATRPESLL